MKRIPPRTLHRLCVYRKILKSLIYDGVKNIYSRKLASVAGSTPEQVRNDLMTIGYSGSSVSGYDVAELEYSIGYFIDNPEGLRIAMLGLDDFGRALLHYCYWRYPNLAYIAAFDEIQDYIDKGSIVCECHHTKKLKEILDDYKIDVVILARVFDNSAELIEECVNAGVSSILNYTHSHLEIPDDVHHEDMDMMLRLDKISFYTKTKK